MERWTPRRGCFSVSGAKKRSTWLIQEADELAGRGVEGGERRQGAVALVVVAPRRAAWPGRVGNSGLGPVEGLDLALPVDTEDQRPFRRIEIGPYNILAPCPRRTGRSTA